MGERAEPSDPFGLAGTLLERKYRIDRVVAEGGFGVVYAGHHLALDAAVAIKVLRPMPNVDPEAWGDAVARFLLEAKAIAKLRHSAVVGVLDSGVATSDRFPAGVPWIVLEWIDGETLAQHLAKRRGSGGRSSEETLRLLRPVLEAIASAHEAGISHRDLKPSNIMFAPSPEGPRARVLDFGIAKLAGDEPQTTSGDTQTASNERAFSTVCAAPEQVSGTRTGPWTDVYALALLVTEVLTDMPPYPVGDGVTTMSAVFDAQRPTPAKLGFDVGSWEPVLARALSVPTTARQANARELLADLDRTVPDAIVNRVAEAKTQRSESGAPTAAARDATTKAEPLSPSAPRSHRSLWWSFGIGSAAAAAAIGVGVRSRQHTTAASTVPTKAACATNHECSATGAPSICRLPAGECVALASPDCTPLADARALASEDTVWIGSMFPLTGADADDFGRTNARAVDLARRDFAQTLSGLTASRPFGVVSCDDAVDPRRAAAHLVDVGVPAVIGFRSGAEAIDLPVATFLPNHVLSICATSTNPLVTRVPQTPGEPRLVWRTTYEFASTVGALAAFVSDVLEPQARARGELGAKESLRVARVRPKNAMQSALADAVVRTLRINGKTISEDDRAFRDLSFDPEAAPASGEYARVASELLAFTPHVVLFSGLSTAVNEVLAPVEERWPAAARHRPRYASIASITPGLLDLIGTSDERRHRVFGVSPPSSTPANLQFVSRYAETYPDDHVTKTNAPNTSYDAFYLLAYATYALPHDEPVSGPALARAFARLQPPGKRIEAGMPGIFDGYSELTAGRAIDLVGATGDLDLDLATGEAALDEAILCVAAGAPDAPPPDGKAHATEGVESGLVYSASKHELAGKMRCP